MECSNYLVMKDIYKSFSSVKVLNGIDFCIRKGEVHGCLGGNGAGKSTLMNILGGIYTKDKGSIFIDGREVEINSPMQAIEHGISFIHQELKLFSMRSVADNIFMSRLPTKGTGLVDDRAKNQKAKKWLDIIGLDIDPKVNVEQLSIAEQQMVEIAKALSYESQIIIFDEPTSSLTDKEVKTLFKVINTLKKEGVCIIFISHKFDEIFEICDRVTVLRNGENVGTVKISETNTDELVSMVIGVKLDRYYPPIKELTSNEIIFEVKNLVNRKLKNVSFTLKKGEILGIFGLVGAGRSELARAIFGLDYLHSGEIYIQGKQVCIKSPKKAIDAGISFLTEDRRGEGLILNMDINSNINLPKIKSITIPLVGLVKREKEIENTKNAFKKFKIVAENAYQKVKTLSGGNQQKVVLSKWFMTSSQVIILDEPTRGVDIRAKSEIYEFISQITGTGRSVIVISSEVSEILGICHRILVMRDGSIVKEILNSKEIQEEEIMAYAMGGDKTE